jgi:glucokinase
MITPFKWQIYLIRLTLFCLIVKTNVAFLNKLYIKIKNELEIELFYSLKKKDGHVSWERVIAGMDIFNFFIEEKKQKPLQKTLDDIKIVDPGIVITKSKDNVCKKTMHLFISLYGAIHFCK